jgi:hypothetical protein
LRESTGSIAILTHAAPDRNVGSPDIRFDIAPAAEPVAFLRRASSGAFFLHAMSDKRVCRKTDDRLLKLLYPFY